MAGTSGNSDVMNAARAQRLQAQGDFDEDRSAQLAHALDEAAIVAVTDRRGRIVFCNDRFSEISGYSRAELMGSSHRLIASGVHDQAFFQQMWATIVAGDTWRGTICNRRKNGELYWVETTIVPNIDARGRASSYTAIRVDVTSHMLALEALAEAQRQAEADAQAKDHFIANMGHEVRTPLNGVIGVASALARSSLDAPQRELVDLILTSGHSLERILDDILELAKADAGRLSVVEAPFDVRAEVRGAVELFRSEAGGKGVQIGVDFAQDAVGALVGDAVRIRQVVTNLVSNAVKFTEAGRVDVAVGWTGGADPGASGVLTVEVADSGIGFGPEMLEALFERFVQADATISRRFGGTGLGLSICKSLVSLMGGEISATSSPGVGSTFAVRLPLSRAAAGAAAGAAPAGRNGADSLAAVGEGAVRVLLAEDHPTNQRVVKLLLEPFGVEVTIAQDGAEACDLFETGRYDAILMDMQMPVRDGLSATRAIREIEVREGRPRTPVAMMTANTGDRNRHEAFAAGVDDFIAKPVSAETLVGGLERLLARGGGES